MEEEEGIMKYVIVKTHTWLSKETFGKNNNIKEEEGKTLKMYFMYVHVQG